MKIKTVILFFVLVSCIAVGFILKPDDLEIIDGRPNIVLFLADDLGYGDVSWNNSKAVIETPHLDNLAKQGVILTDCYSSSSMCSPSRAGLLTGRSPMRIGIHDWIKEIYKKPLSNIHLPDSETTIPELLGANGYQTAVIGKWHLNNGFRTGNNSDPDHHGFNYWFCTPVQADPSHKNPTNFYDNGEALGQIGTKEHPQFSSGIVADKTMAWLDKRNRNKPFFIYIPFHEPHVVCDAPDEIKEKYLNRISNGEIPLIEGTGADGLGMAEYFASVENMDIAIGRIMKKLASEELLDNTFILFTSDNGPDSNRKYKGRLQSVGETGEFRGRKRWLLEGGIRQASIVYWNNKVKAGSSINTPIGHVDLLPTLCEIAGVNVPNDRTVDGISLVSNLKGEATERKGNPLHWHFYSPRGDSPQSVLRSGKWIITANWDMPRPKGRFNLSAIENIKRANLIDFKLYNIEDDHEQLNDMKELHPDIHKNLMKQLIEIHKSVKEECPGKDNFVWNNHLQNIVDKNFSHLKE